MWARLLVVAVATVGASACVIGPKQDDPSALNEKDVADTSVVTDVGTTTPGADTSPGLFVDAAGDVQPSDTSTTPPPAETGCTTDAADASDADETRCVEGDGGGDAVTDG